MKEIIGKLVLAKLVDRIGCAWVINENGEMVDSDTVFGSFVEQIEQAEQWVREGTGWEPGSMGSLFWYTDSNTGAWTRTVHRKPDRKPETVPKTVSGWPVVRAVPFTPEEGEFRYRALVIVDRGAEHAERSRFVVMQVSSADGISWHGQTGCYGVSAERAAEVFEQRKTLLGSRVRPESEGP